MAKATGKKDQPKAKAGKAEAAAPAGESFQFQTEMQQLLQILIHSLYSEREIFLRELISNASDAINRLRFRMLTNPDVRDPDAELEITVEIDEEGKALIVSDSGSGLTREEAIANLGTIARSGTLEFVKELSQADPTTRLELIGQFGVGFYSVFMVAKRVVVDSCPADPKEAPVRWISEGEGQFSVESGQRTTRGTTIRVELKDDAEEFATPYRVEGIVKRYSNFIPHPIRQDGRRLNAEEAIWTLPPGQGSEEQYNEFYKFLTHGTEEPLHHLHLSIDAPVQYRALLYIPPHITNDVLYSPKGFGLELYASKVLIQRDSQELLPLYLRFMRGVVDTEDLPLNVSREMVQNNPLLARLRKSLTGRVLRDLTALAEKAPDTFATFWWQYGKVLKEGLSSDQDNRDRLLELLRFNTSTCASAEDLIALKDYVARMQPDQKEIYYFTGPSRESLETHPQMEFFRRKNLEVIYLYDQVDDFVFPTLFEYEGKSVTSIDNPDLEVLKDFEPEQAQGEVLEGEPLEALIGYLKSALGEQVSEVRASKRLVESPALIASSEGIPGNLQKMMRMMGQDVAKAPKVLEINPGHALIRDMAALHHSDAAHPLLAQLAEQLFENCLLMEGLMEHPERMVGRIQDLMTRAAALEAAQAESSAGSET